MKLKITKAMQIMTKNKVPVIFPVLYKKQTSNEIQVVNNLFDKYASNCKNQD